MFFLKLRRIPQPHSAFWMSILIGEVFGHFHLYSSSCCQVIHTAKFKKYFKKRDVPMICGQMSWCPAIFARGIYHRIFSLRARKTPTRPSSAAKCAAVQRSSFVQLGSRPSFSMNSTTFCTSPLLAASKRSSLLGM